MFVYAVIRAGSKQYRVKPGDTLRVEKVTAEAGSKVEIRDVLMVEKDGQVQLGTPLVSNATVEATILGHDRSKKILVFKKKRKKQFRRTRGHRQQYTALKIEDIKF